VPAEDISMRDPLLLNGISQGPGYVVLANDVRKALRPVFSRQYLIAHV
jgi:hypothetical protein